MKSLLKYGVLVALVLATSTTAQGQKRVALVIGNSEYPTSPLTNPVNDAGSMEVALKSLGFSVIKQINRTKTEMENDIDAVTDKLNDGDVCFVFYAGHGIGLEESNFLIPVDAKVTRKHHVQERCVRLSYLMNAIENSDASLKVLVLDCCRNNPFRSFFRSESDGLANVEAPDGTVIAFSTRPGDVALDGDGKNSPYTSHLVRTIGEDHSEGLELVEMFRRTAVNVRKETGQKGFFRWDISMDQYLIKPNTVELAGVKKKQPNSELDGAMKLDAKTPAQNAITPMKSETKALVDAEKASPKLQTVVEPSASLAKSIEFISPPIKYEPPTIRARIIASKPDAQIFLRQKGSESLELSTGDYKVVVGYFEQCEYYTGQRWRKLFTEQFWPTVGSTTLKERNTGEVVEIRIINGRWTHRWREPNKDDGATTWKLVDFESKLDQ